MTIIDYVIIAIVLIGLVRGLLKGVLKQLASIAGFLIGLVAARALYTSLAEKICPVLTDSMTVAQVISFIAIWLIVPILCLLLASLLTHALEAVSLGWVNRLLGLVLGALMWILILSLLINVYDYLDTNHVLINQTIKKESMLYYPLKELITNLFPFAKKLTEQYILT